MLRLSESELRDVARELLDGVDAPPETADAVATSLASANRCGHDSHGVIRVPVYAEMVDDGAIDPHATPVVERAEGATATVDGRNAFGQVVGREAVEVAADRAEEYGVAAVGVRDATHLGRIGEWAERTVERGLIFAAFVSAQGGSELVAPPGSTQGRLSTNPVAFAVPTYDALEFPLLVDVATSQVANGKISERAVRGEPLPEGWAIAPSGEPLFDPSKIATGEGAILPLGGTVSGYKGFGLSVLSILLSATLSDGMVAGQGARGWYNNVAAFVVVDPLRFTTREATVERVAALAAYLRETEFSPDVPVGPGAKGETTLLPGEAEYLTARERDENGIPVPDRVVDSLDAFARERGLDVSIG